jgi:hypothetical protein
LRACGAPTGVPLSRGIERPLYKSIYFRFGSIAVIEWNVIQFDYPLGEGSNPHQDNTRNGVRSWRMSTSGRLRPSL